MQNYDIKQRCTAFELDVEKLFAHRRRRLTVDKIARYPAVERDIAVVLAHEISAAAVIKAIKDAETELLKDVVVFDLYSGEQVAAGYKSMAFRLTFQSMERTLTDNDINSCVNRIMERLQTDFKAELR
ncbi:MAG TPA: hypothetical protein GXX58_03735 [Gelria sp.]|nr:hypothetical protein [Gelria sp.]